MKTFYLIFLSALILFSCVPKEPYYDQKQYEVFENEFNKLEGRSPEKLEKSFRIKIKKDKLYKKYKGVYSKLTKSQIKNEIVSFYTDDTKKHLELCAKMVEYQCTVRKKQKLTLSQYIKKLGYTNMNKIDLLILKSLNEAAESDQKSKKIDKRLNEN